MIRNSFQNGRLGLHTNLLNFSKPIADLSLNQFPVPARPARTGERLQDVQAIFAFSFGYRLKTRAVTGKKEEQRLPGVNNRALATIAARLKLRLGSIPLYAQFEIADALDDYMDIRADYSSPAEDLGTGAVVASFKEQAGEAFQQLKRVVVVAHQHHVARCVLLLLNDFDIEAVPAVETYSEYDPGEAQPRVISAEEFILSDFVSMAAHRPWSKMPA
jgi:hypothetical protein